MEFKTIRLALADKQATGVILDCCEPVTLGGVVWRDTERLRNCSSVVWEIKYLRTRGLLQHHPMIQKLVRLKEV